MVYSDIYDMQMTWLLWLMDIIVINKASIVDLVWGRGLGEREKSHQNEELKEIVKVFNGPLEHYQATSSKQVHS